MKQLLLTAILAAGVTGAQGALYSYSGDPYTIPDGNPNGVYSSITVSGLSYPITSLSVNLDVSGGYNGDLYAYLSYGGTTVVLLNRIGVSSSNPFGYSSSGFVITLAADGTDIHNYGGGPLAGTWQADGRNISPFSSPASFDSTEHRGNLSQFNEMNGNGTWTLYFADVSGGGGSATLNGWSLEITAVPEPVNVALLGFAAIAGIAMWRRAAQKRA